MTNPPLSWCQVLEDEYRALHGVGPFDGTAAPADKDERLQALHQRIHEQGPSAVCLSGGGIRSSTFALGVLQGLAYVGVLGKIDYLSTVSGGGYTGGWFTAWLQREGPAGRDEVLKTIDPGRARHHAHCGKESNEESPVERLRRTCRYLAPRGGVVSADVWSLVTTMARNLVLNWLVILPLLAAALMIPRIYYGGIQAVEHSFVDVGVQAVEPWYVLRLPPAACNGVQGDAMNWSFLVAISSFLISSTYALLNLVGLGGRWAQGRFLGWFLVPTVVGAVAITFYWSAAICPAPLPLALMMGSTIPAAGWIFVGAIASHVRRQRGPDDGSAVRVRVGVRTVIAALASGPILSAGMWWLGSFEYGFGASEAMRQLYAVFAVPLVLAFALMQMTVFIGMASSEMDDPVLEWYSRCGAWVAIAAVLWMAAGGLVFYMADVVELGVSAASRATSINHKATSAALLALVPLLSSLAGLWSRGGGAASGPLAWIRLGLQKVTLPAAILVLLSTIAWADVRAAQRLEYHWHKARKADSPWLADAPCSPAVYEGLVKGKEPRPDATDCHTAGGGVGENVVLFGGLLLFGLMMSRFVPVNRFSLHGMYRQRLIRTFLGASRRDRHPNGFTGFDANDDICVHELKDVRPLHVICTTLNSKSSTHVGRHETEAQSFTFTPLHVGNHDLGYRPASEFGSDGGGSGTGLSLGMALAVSGAAASSAMGRFSSKSRAFLLTLANGRLGLWFGNPDNEKTYQKSEPPLSVGPLMRELLGLTTDHNPYVYLSDGGHYENLGLWEMVARRCRFIIVSDAGCDPKYSFEDLANAVRRIRLDLGIPIHFDPIDVTCAGQNQGNPHGAIGRIEYSVVDGAAVKDGTILYLKATMSGDEPVDVRNFSFTDPSFPHDSTANQFFDEARFESYRTLGFHTVLSVTAGLKRLPNAEALCNTARQALAELEAKRHSVASAPVAT